MLKLKPVVFPLIAAGIFMSLTSITTKAQIPNPSASAVASARQRGPCRDPWITIAIESALSRSPQGVGTFGECNPSLYNGGSWGSYNELYQGVRTAFSNLNGNVSISRSSLANGQYKIVMDAGSGFVWTQIISHDGGTLITSDGAGVVASGGGNFRVQSTSTEKKISLGKSVLIIRKK